MAITDKLTAIADAIRAKTGKTNLLNMEDMAVEQDAVFDAGKAAGTDAFWDVVQDNGNRTMYNHAFSCWGHEYIRPKYKLVASYVNDANTIFAHAKVKKVEAAYFDFSQKPTGTNNNSGYNYTFYNCTELEEIEDIGLVPQYTYVYTFANCAKLRKIAKIGVDENTRFSNAFQGCYELRDLVVDGVIGQNGFSVINSTKLTHDSLMSIINCLETKTSGTWTVTLGATNLAKLTDAEKAIATQRGWTLA